MCAAACLIAGAAVLSGCSSSAVIDNLPASLGGLPEGVPERPVTPAAFPAVHDMPPPRADATLSEAEKKKLKADLAATREQTEQRAGIKKADPAKKPSSTVTGSAQAAGASRDP